MDGITICFTISLSLIDFFVIVPVLLAIILRQFQFLHRKVTSDIPGNPHAFDDCVISLFRTLPEPSNFNIVWTSVLLSGKEPLIIRGKKPNSRFNSITIYNSEKLNDPPLSFDLENVRFNDLGEFEIALVKNSQSLSSPLLLKGKYSFVIDCKNWNRCMISMRNYLVVPGSRIVTPEIYNTVQNVIVRPHQNLIAGPVSTKSSLLLDMTSKTIYLSIVNIVTSMALHFIFIYSIPSVLTIIVSSGLLASIYRWLCFQSGKRSLKTMVSTITNKTHHKFIYPSSEQSSKASQPSLLHKYWIMSFDLSRKDQTIHQELRIYGEIDPSLQKYWSVVVYDEYGLPLPQYLYDDNVIKQFTNHTPNDNLSSVYGYDIRLSIGSAELIKGQVQGERGEMKSSLPSDINRIDVSSCQKGYVLFRIIHPTDENQILSSYQPSAEFLVNSNRTSENNKSKNE